MLNDAAGAAGNKHPWVQRRGLTDLLPRVLSASVLMAAGFVSVWQGGLVFDLVWLCAALAVGYEWQILITARYPRFRIFLAGLGLVLAAYFAGMDWFGTACAVLGASGLAAALAAGPGRRIWALGGIIYAGLLLVALGALHGPEGYGARAIVWLFAVVWGTDAFAYFGGRLIGGAKLWPKVSPSKTWSGTLTGVFSGAVLGTAAGAYGLEFPAHAPLFALGLSAAAISQAGDLFESWVKRRFGSKDSSGLIPGHGGFMDRLDGFVAAAAFAAFAGAMRGGPTVAAGLFEWS